MGSSSHATLPRLGALDLTATVHQVAMPMRRPFGHARATRKLAEGVIVRLRIDDTEGVGECVPREYVTGEVPETVFDAIASFDLDSVAEIAAASDYARAVPLLEQADLASRLSQGGKPGLSAACCLELALLDAIGRRAGASIRDVAGPLDLPAALCTDGGEIHRFTRAMDASKTAESIFRPGDLEVYSVLKVKVGLGRDLDLERVRAARDVVGPEFTISVDANMAWSLDEACKMAELLSPMSIAWYEEPMARGAFEDCAEFRRRTGARVMLDESLCSRDDAERAVAHESCDLFNIRISKHGGMVPSLRLAELAAARGLGMQLGTHPGAHGILRAAEWQLMHMVTGFEAVEAARSNAWFEQELIEEKLEIDRTARRVRRLDGPGLGVHLAPERLSKHAVRTAEIGARRST